MFIEKGKRALERAIASANAYYEEIIQIYVEKIVHLPRRSAHRTTRIPADHPEWLQLPCGPPSEGPTRRRYIHKYEGPSIPYLDIYLVGRARAGSCAHVLGHSFKGARDKGAENTTSPLVGIHCTYVIRAALGAFEAGRRCRVVTT